MKIDREYMIESFNNVSDEYGNAVSNVGIWESELDLINTYADNKSMKILDMGCGAGRCAFGLENMGYQYIDAIDFSPLMIEKAKQVKSTSKINFEVGDCTCIEKASDTYDFILFSFNGLMQIPKHEHRVKALSELHRVLNKGGVLIFTTHDRNNGDRRYIKLWEEEKALWDKNKQDERLHEFGDVLSFDDNNEVEYFIHIPDYKEIEMMLSDFTILESFIRSEKYVEKKEVQDFSDDCRFWVVRK